LLQALVAPNASRRQRGAMRERFSMIVALLVLGMGC